MLFQITLAKMSLHCNEYFLWWTDPKGGRRHFFSIIHERMTGILKLLRFSRAWSWSRGKQVVFPKLYKLSREKWWCLIQLSWSSRCSWKFMQFPWKKWSFCFKFCNFFRNLPFICLELFIFCKQTMFCDSYDIGQYIGWFEG